MMKNWTEKYSKMKLQKKDTIETCPDNEISSTTTQHEVNKIKNMCSSENCIVTIFIEIK